MLEKWTFCPDADVVEISFSGDNSLFDPCVTSVGSVTGGGASLSKTLIVIVLAASVPVSFIVYGSLFATPYTL